MTNRTKLTLLALIMFAATNIQSAETQEAATPTQQLYAAIDALDLEALQQILRAHPDEADKISENVYGRNQTPLRAIFYKYTKDVDQNEINTLNAITTALLDAGANPSKIIEPSEKEMKKNVYVRSSVKSPLTECIDIIFLSLDDSQAQLQFLKTLLTYQYPEDTNFNVNQAHSNSTISIPMNPLDRAMFSSCREWLIKTTTLEQLQAIKMLIVARAQLSKREIPTPSLQSKISWSLSSFFASTYFFPTYWLIAPVGNQLPKDKTISASLKYSAYKAMIAVDREKFINKEAYSNALDTVIEDTIKADNLLQSFKSKIGFSCLTSGAIVALAVACKKYHAHKIVAFAGKWVMAQCKDLLPKALAVAAQ